MKFTRVDEPAVRCDARRRTRLTFAEDIAQPGAFRLEQEFRYMRTGASRTRDAFAPARERDDSRDYNPVSTASSGSRSVNASASSRFRHRSVYQGWATESLPVRRAHDRYVLRG